MHRYSVTDMSCDHCRAKIEDAVLDADGGAALTFDMEAREVAVDSVLETGEVLGTLKGAGDEAVEIG